ncbi:hypothetical protein [Legionella fallonii]|uniref:MHD2 domain-containing protein n=1 Tax=Legionella fallonii LLAP-10 TaxID=1212491 RepID=A0A098G804_9GAMM|nr:hypothetical protein [Legionella fallonii]CEG58592.1 protein of unknown function [Legionella fallonii LLAP-10]
MKINFKFTTDVLSHWPQISYLRLDSIEFIIEDYPGDHEASTRLKQGFPEADSDGEPVVREATNNDSPDNCLVMDGAGYRIDLLDSMWSARIIDLLSRCKKLFITDSVSSEQEHNLQVFEQYLKNLSIEIENLKTQYLNTEFLEIITADWHRSFRYAQELLQNPENTSEEPSRLYDILMHNIDELKKVLTKLEEDYPQDEGDIISLEQRYSACSSPQRLSVNLFKAVTQNCIEELTLCANKLSPDYYRNAIHQYETQFTELLSQFPGYAGEKAALIQRIQHYFIPSDIDSCERKELCKICSNLNRMHDIITNISKYQALNEDSFNGLEMIFLLADDEPNEKIIQIHNQMTSLFQLGLVMPETITPLFLFGSSFPDKSCPARTTATGYAFFGAASRDEDSYKRMWTIYSIGAEHLLAATINEGKPLQEQLSLAADIRQRIAIYRKESNNPYNFGGVRIGKSLQDTYSNDSTSIINTSLFPTVARIISQNYDLPALIAEASSKSQSKNNIFTITLINKLAFQLDGGEEIELPDQEMQLTIKQNPKKLLTPLQVSVQFSELDQETFERMLRFFDEHFLARCKSKELNDEEFVTELGKLVFHLVRSYPYHRGTASILQWVTRGMISNFTNGIVNLGDIRLGDSSESTQNIPYDVYAHLVQSPEVYAEAFTAAVLPLFTAHYAPSRSFAKGSG